MPQYVPLFRPGTAVTFEVTTAVTGGHPVQVGTANRSVAPAAASSVTVVGIAGHDAAVGDQVTVEVGKPIHELKASGAVALGDFVEAAGNGAIRTATTGTKIGMAISAAADGALAQIIQA